MAGNSKSGRAPVFPLSEAELVAKVYQYNLLINGHITLKQYLERLPSGYVAKKHELIAEIAAKEAAAVAASMAPMPQGTGMSKQSIDDIPVQGGSGNGELQMALNRQGV